MERHREPSGTSMGIHVDCLGIQKFLDSQLRQDTGSDEFFKFFGRATTTKPPKAALADGW